VILVCVDKAIPANQATAVTTQRSLPEFTRVQEWLNSPPLTIADINEYWPHLFLADRHGIVEYDHIGEGAYDRTEQKIRQLLG
jgi:hypothetical protein